MKLRSTKVLVALICLSAVALWGLATLILNNEKVAGSYMTPSEAPNLQMSFLDKKISALLARGGHIGSANRLSAYYGFGPGEREESISLSEASARYNYWLDVAAKNGDMRVQYILVNKRFENYSWDPTGTKKWLEEAAAKGWAGAKETLERIRKLESDATKPK